jgi:hypothetical protein
MNKELTKYRNLFDLTASQDQINDLIIKLKTVVPMEEFDKVKERLGDYHLKKEALHTRNVQDARFERIEASVEEKAGRDEMTAG